MVGRLGAFLTSLCIVLSAITSYVLFKQFGHLVYIQFMLILIIAAVGEHYVSGKGYYHYTKKNGLFLGRVPVWIPLMWVVMIQGSFSFLLVLGFGSTEAIALSGLVCASLDFYLIEPLFSRKIGMWLWSSVERGYFGFIPPQVNRFTAPAGNYITWMFFPVILNALLHYGSLILPSIL
jgi:hypothetical protein